MGKVEQRVDQLHPGRLLAGGFGAAVVGGRAAVLGVPVVVLHGVWGWPVLSLVIWIGSYWGYTFGTRKSEDLQALAGLSTRPLVRAAPYKGETDEVAVLLDTRAVIDGRMLPLVRSGFLHGSLLVPPFVLDELQTIADAQAQVRRRRGRRALETLESLQQFPGIEVHVLDDEVPEHDEVDAKLVALARRLRVRLLTVDGALQKVAELQGVRCLSLHRLSEGLKQAHLPGDRVRLPITRNGKEPGQGVGFLDDGTMVVVADAMELIGQEIDARITSNVQTSVGRMLFASIDDDDRSPVSAAEAAQEQSHSG
jgi:uncharacterized protein YacL